MVTKQDIIQAHERIAPYIHRTPVLTCEAINKITGADIIFKCENFQKVGAFKSRGAVNAVFSLDENQIQKGVCTHSSGNHAQALARAAALRNAPAYIVMPENAPKVKIDAVRGYGGIITFCIPTLEARETTLAMIVEKTGAYEIHPYNNFQVIAGQASAIKEVLDDGINPDIVMTPVGGGGLLSGTSLSCHYFGENIQVIGAEPLNANDAFLSFQKGEIVPALKPNTIADGLLTSLGDKTFSIIQQNVNQILTTSEENIKKALFLILERMKIVVEPSSAVPLAVILEHPEVFKNKKVVIVISGGNVDLKELKF
jgi:threonine dehydratase